MAAARRPRSLAARLAIAFAIALVVFCAAVAFVVDNAVLRGLEGDLENDLDAQARHVAAVIAERRDPRSALADHVRRVSESHIRPRLMIRIRSAEGALLAESPDAARILAPGPAASGRDPFVEPDPGWARRTAGATDAAGRTYLVDLLADGRNVDRFIDRFRRNLVLLVTPLLAAGILAAYWFVKRTLAPLEDVTAAAARVGSTTLGERLKVPRASGEVARLAGSFNEMLDRLEDAFRRLQDFGADLAHELRTPVQNLRGEAEVALLRLRSPEEYREVLAETIEECGRLARIIDDVLLLSRVERHEEALEIASFDLAEELEEIREYYDDVAAARGVRLSAASPRPLRLFGDRAMLRRAVANLVDNALKYTDAGGRVDIEALEEDDGTVEIVVADTGKGIAPEHLPKLFERFYRVEKSRSREFGGSGLGLGIARTLVRAHGGDVTIESEVGKGTRARIRLPKAKEAGAPAGPQGVR